MELIRDEIKIVCSDLGNTLVPVSLLEARTHTDCVICYCAIPIPKSIYGAVANDIDFITVAGKAMMPMKDIKFEGGLKQNSKNITRDVGAHQVATNDGGDQQRRRR